MTDPIDEELERFSQPPPAGNQLVGEDLRRPLRALLSKAAISVDETAPVSDAIAMMRDKAFGAVCVTRDGRLTGIITERDLVERVIGLVELSVPVKQVMTPEPVTLRQDDAIAHACHNMQVGGYRHVPVVDAEGKPVSTVSIKDVVRFVLNHFPDEVLNVLPEPYRGPATTHSG